MDGTTATGERIAGGRDDLTAADLVTDIQQVAEHVPDPLVLDPAGGDEADIGLAAAGDLPVLTGLLLGLRETTSERIKKALPRAHDELDAGKTAIREMNRVRDELRRAKADEELAVRNPVAAIAILAQDRDSLLRRLSDLGRSTRVEGDSA